jgi:FMN phosphatase YigB (HAD superfamily)
MPSPAILFDIGNVLVRFDFALAVRKLEPLCDLPADLILDTIQTAKLGYEDGQLGDDEFIRRATELLGFKGGAGEFVEAWNSIFFNNPAMEQEVAALADRVPLWLLSNTSEIHLQKLFRDFNVFRHFRGGVFSHRARCSKPSPKIFQRVIEECELTPERTFFVDDLEANIQTARELGFHTHHYRHDRHAAFQTALADWLRIAE